MIRRFLCAIGFHRMRPFYQSDDLELVSCLDCPRIEESY